MRALQYPGYKSFIGRNELKRLMQSTFLTWVKVCHHHGLRQGEHWTLDGKYNVINLYNGSKIDLLDCKFNPAEDPLFERFGSLEYTDGALEEAGEIHPLARDILKSRRGRQLNREHNINPALINTGNPKKNWTYQVFYKPWKEGKLPEDMCFIQSLYGDNPHTAEEYGKVLSKLKDPVARARLMDGNWEYENDPAALMDYDAITDLFSNALPEREDGYEPEKYATCDVARFGGDKIVLILWKGWEAYKVIYKERQGLETTKQWVLDNLQAERIPRSHCIADEDGVGGGLIDMLPGIKGFMANTSPIITEKRPEALNRREWEEQQKNPQKAYANLKTQCSYLFADKANKRECAISANIDETTKQWIIEELEQVKEKNIDTDDKKKHLVGKDEVKAVIGRSPDFGDALIMRSYFDLREVRDNADEISFFVPSFIHRKK